MDINEFLQIDRLRGGELPKAKPTPAGGGQEFGRLLDELHELSQPKPAESQHTNAQPTDPVDFKRAVRQADDDFVTLMDLRRQLEDAFKKHQR